MHLMYFTEQPMSAYFAQAGLDFGATALMFSNRHFDPVAGSRLYNEYLEHYTLVDELGFDGIMLNEHHNAPFCMQARANIFAAIIAAVTKNVKIVILGNPLPLSDNPVQLAEEIAMIDMVSKGRVVSGFGNDGESGFEGCRAGHVYGTYLHGPLLPRNPWFADRLLAEALAHRTGGEVELPPLDDALEREAFAVAAARARDRGGRP